jgi:hypothetical protein
VVQGEPKNGFKEKLWMPEKSEGRRETRGVDSNNQNCSIKFPTARRNMIAIQRTNTYI